CLDHVGRIRGALLARSPISDNLPVGAGTVLDRDQGKARRGLRGVSPLCRRDRSSLALRDLCLCAGTDAPGHPLREARHAGRGPTTRRRSGTTRAGRGDRADTRGGAVVNEPCLGGRENTICVLPWAHIACTIDGVWSRCCFDATNDYDTYYRQEDVPE